MSGQSESASENVTGGNSGTNTPQQDRSNGSRRNRNRSTRASREKKSSNNSSNNLPNNENAKTEKSSKSSQAKTQKPKIESKDFRFLEVSKLVKKHLPITINGYSVAKVLESYVALRNANNEGESQINSSKNLPRKAKEAVLIEHIQNVIRKDPQQALYLSFIMKVDPDFPFELDSLNFSLTIPADYPKSTKSLPSIVVLNTEIPRGFSVNIERGFRSIVNIARNNNNTPAFIDEEIKMVDGKGLLSQVQTLNKYLEVFLQQEKRQTMKFITFKNSAKPSDVLAPSSTSTPPPQAQKKVDLAAAALEESSGDVSEATRLKREYFIGEMTQKLGASVKLFNRSKTEARYKVQIPIVNLQNMPQLWTYGNSVVDVFLTVPDAYPELPIRAIVASNFSSNLLVAKKNALVGEGRDLIALVEEARKAEKNFNKNASRHAIDVGGSLVQILNWVSNHLAVLVQSESQYEVWQGQMKSLAVN